MKYKENVIIPSYHVDVNLRLTPVAFMDLAQEMAYLGAEGMHFGYADLQERHWVWVLSRMHIVFNLCPKWRESVQMLTWCKGFYGPLCLRDFLMKGAKEENLISCTTSWAIIDITSRNMIRANELADVLPENAICADHAIETPAKKVVMPKHAAKVFAGEHAVSYSDVDMVGHTNNTRYVSLAMNCIDYHFLVSHSIKELTINFNHETKPGEKLQLFTVQEADTWFVEGFVNQQQAFIVRMDF